MSLQVLVYNMKRMTGYLASTHLCRRSCGLTARACRRELPLSRNTRTEITFSHDLVDLTRSPRFAGRPERDDRRAGDVGQLNSCRNQLRLNGPETRRIGLMTAARY